MHDSSLDQIACTYNIHFPTITVNDNDKIDISKIKRKIQLNYYKNDYLLIYHV